MSGRACKAGDAFANEKKMEQRYDEEEKLGSPQRIIEWIQKVLPDSPKCPGFDQKSIYSYLKDGAILCKLLNKLLQSNGEATFKYKEKAMTAFVAMENIEKFNKACEGYGVPVTSLFQTLDLHEGRRGPMLNVINCLNQLGFTANNKGFMPDYEAVEAPKADF